MPLSDREKKQLHKAMERKDWGKSKDSKEILSWEDHPRNVGYVDAGIKSLEKASALKHEKAHEEYERMTKGK